MRFLMPGLFGAVVLFFGLSADAASLYLDPSDVTVDKGENITVTLRLDTDTSECINSVDVVLNFDQGLQVSDVSIGNSIFSLWVQPPEYDNDAHTVSLAGGIPNGYCGRIEGDPQLTNTIAEIIFRAPTFSIGDTGVVPERKISFAETATAYLNDGLGTAVAIEASGATITVNDAFSSGENDPWKARVQDDDSPPKQFSITLTKDDSAFHGKYFIVFNTNDKQTGIDHYEVIEEPMQEFDFFSWGAATTPWRKATSPYVLEDQTLNSVIRVKALDKAGNEYVASMVADESIRGLNSNKAIMYVLLAFSVVVLLLVIWLLWIHLTRRRHDHMIMGSNHDEFDYKSDDENNAG